MNRWPETIRCSQCGGRAHDQSGICDSCFFSPTNPCLCSTTPLSCFEIPRAPWEPARKPLATCKVVDVVAESEAA